VKLRHVATFALLTALALPLVGCDSDGGPSAAAGAPDLSQVDLPNKQTPQPGVVTGGQPSEEQLEGASKAGVKVVVNLRGADEPKVAETGEAARRFGMEYIHIPLSKGAANLGLNEENARALAEVLGGAVEQPVLVHCGSGNRVGALFSLKAFYVDGKSADESLQAGLDAGLTGLEDRVKQLLEAAEAARNAATAAEGATDAATEAAESAAGAARDLLGGE
jgi:uncharacterized protein (TIGR01244 family)